MAGEYKEGITLITPTGDRELALDRCCFYINRQILKPNQWIVIDDGKKATTESSEHDTRILFIRRPFCNNQKKSFTGNILAALPHIKYDKIMFIEDDDWYHSQYIEQMALRLTNYDLVGESRAVYYNVRERKYRIQGNTDRASLCQTAIRSAVIPTLENCCLPRESAFIDARLWQKNIRKKLFEDKRYCVGIKGMPGRKGIGIGHRPGASYKSDLSFYKLAEFIGLEDAQFYIDLGLKIE